MTGLYIALGLSALFAALWLAVVIQTKRLRKAKEDAGEWKASYEAEHAENRNAAKELERLRVVIAALKVVDEEAKDERKALEATADSGLVTRANALFGMRKRGKRQGGNGT
jgi:hypothetical protein